jgi:hypothetical protein
MLWLASGAAATLNSQLDKKVSTLGEAIQLHVSGPANLSELDLTPLKKDFEVFSSAASISNSHGREQSALDVTLYPLHSGTLPLPPLVMKGTRTHALQIEIQPGDVTLRAWLTPELPMEREPVTLHLEIRDDGSLNWAMPTQLDAPHISLRPLRDSPRSGETSGIHEYRWTVLPLKSGSLGIGFGMLDAYKFGQRLRFALSAVSFRALPAPAYLPLHIPIGKPLLRADAIPQQLIADQPVEWNVDIDAPGLSADGALKLVQFDTPPGLHFYAPSAAPIKIDGREKLRLTLTFTANRHAQIFPAVHLAYFDAQTQRIEALSLPAATFTVRDPGLEKMFAALFAVLGLLILAVLGFQARPWLRRLKMKRHWLTRINTARDPSQLYRALSQEAPWHVATPELWPESVRSRITPVLRAQLAQCCFGPARDEKPFEELKTAWAKACTQLPLRYFT